MSIAAAYNHWAEQYDTNINRTRDLEAIALRQTLNSIVFGNCLEIGCGTGKNSEWLVTKAKQLMAVDFSAAMLAKAKAKITADNISFIQADITKEWSFTDKQFHLITFSLVLEHIENLDHIFKACNKHLTNNGFVYIGELHPMKQYAGSKARFETAAGISVVDCFTHHVSEFINIAKQNGLHLQDIAEYFDEDNKTIPRILRLVLKK
jgi:2-polyprenyl-3-methyl-5-hydroxy-6-metoxy-1,4-benzoquinol methylase